MVMICISCSHINIRIDTYCINNHLSLSTLLRPPHHMILDRYPKNLFEFDRLSWRVEDCFCFCIIVNGQARAANETGFT